MMAFAGVPTYELDLKIGCILMRIEALQAELLHAITPAKRLSLQNKLAAAVVKRHSFYRWSHSAGLSREAV